MSSRRLATAPSAEKRNPAPLLLAALVALLAAYYVTLTATGFLNASTAVPIEEPHPVKGSEYVTLQVKLQDVDITNRVLQATVLPAPRGSLVGRKAGEMTRSLRIEIVSGGKTESVLTFPGSSIIHPTPVDLTIDRGDTAYPFDRPFVDFSVSVQDDRTGRPVPFALELENSARPWVIAASLGEAATDDGSSVFPVQLDGHRDRGTVVLVLFYMLVILLTTMIAVVTIGSALVRGVLEFSNVIWLSATMLAFPTLRGVLPGAPPLGTALDYLVFLPCISVVAVMLVWAGAHLLWRDGAVLMGRRESPADDHGRTTEDAVNDG